MDTVIWWVGFATVMVLAGAALRVFWAMAVAVVATASFFRWRLAVCRAHGAEIQWRRVPSVLLRTWIDFVPYKRGRITFHSQDGKWNGIGDWTVFPPSSNA